MSLTNSKQRNFFQCDERGSISAFVVVLTMTFVVCAGLAIDGGRLVAAKVKASDTAENAARTGAQALTNLRSGVPQIEPRRAIRLASSYLTSVGVVGQIRASEFEVCVVVRSVESMTLLKLVGLNSKSVSSQRCARAIGG